MAVDQPVSDAIPESPDEQVVTSFEGPIHVSFKRVKNTAPSAKYKMQIARFDLVTSSKGTPGARVQLKFDPQLHPGNEKRSVIDRFWFTPEAMNMYLGFLVACKINSELLREEPVDPPQFNPDGSPVTHCVYSVEDQLKSIYGGFVYAQVGEEEYDTKAADGVTEEKAWRNTVEIRGYSKV